MKKILALILVLVFALGLVSCSGGVGTNGMEDDPNQQVTLKWATIEIGHADDAVVFEKFNQKLNELLPNTKVEFVELDSENWTRWMAAKEQVDIAWSGYSFDMATQIDTGSYLALDELIEKYAPNIKQERIDYKDDYNTAVVNDQLYAIPNQQPILQQTPGIRIPYQAYDYMPWDELFDSLRKTPYISQEFFDVIHKYLKAVMASPIADTDIVGKAPNFQSLQEIYMRGYDTVATDLYYKAFEDEVVVENKYETEAYKLMVENMERFVADGLYDPEDYDNGTRIPLLSVSLTEAWYNLNDERGIYLLNDDFGDPYQYVALVDSEDQLFNGAANIGAEKTYLVIPFTTKYAARAIKLIDLMRDPDLNSEGNKLFNYLVYGDEGTHYEKTEEACTEDGILIPAAVKGADYSIQPTAASQYGIPHWVIGNVYLAYRTTNITKDSYKYAYNWDRVERFKIHRTPVEGFRATFSGNLDITRSNVNLAANDFTYIGTGAYAATRDSIYASMISKMEQAGLRTYIEEIQKQVDDYIAQKAAA